MDVDGEELKNIDRPYARQVTALVNLCKRQPNLAFKCNPSKVMLLGGDRVYYMGEYILDNQMRGFGLKPIMLSLGELRQAFVIPDSEVAFSQAVLVRLPTEEEKEEQTRLLPEPLKEREHFGCLELLRFVENPSASETVTFTFTGLVEFYIH